MSTAAPTIRPICVIARLKIATRVNRVSGVTDLLFTMVFITPFLKPNAHPLFSKGGRQIPHIFHQRPAEELGYRITFFDLVVAGRLGYFQVGLVISSLESIAIDLRRPTPHGSLALFAPLRHQFTHV